MIKTRVENSGYSKLAWLTDSHSHFFQLIELLVGNDDQKGPPGISDGELAAKAKATLQSCETNMKLVHILATAYGFKTRHSAPSR